MSIGRNFADFCIVMFERFGVPFGKSRRRARLPKFVLAGPSGVGKTHISTSVSKDLQALMSVPERTYLKRPIEITLGEGSSGFLLFDTPGHVAGAGELHDALRDVTLEGSYGVILVASFGFHESRSMDAPDVVDGRIDDRWLEEKRLKEVDMFNSLLSRAMILKKPRIVVTLVNKADLWGDDWGGVKSYYEDAQYHEQITSEGVQHVIMQYCVVPKKFWKLSEPIPKLDNDEAQELHRVLLAMLKEFVDEAST